MFFKVKQSRTKWIISYSMCSFPRHQPFGSSSALAQMETFLTASGVSHQNSHCTEVIPQTKAQAEPPPASLWEMKGRCIQDGALASFWADRILLEYQTQHVISSPAVTEGTLGTKQATKE